MSEEYAGYMSATRSGEPVRYRTVTFLRSERAALLPLLTVILIFTVIYGTLEDPFRYSFSNLGNHFPYRDWYVAWAFVTGFSLYFSVISLFELTDFQCGYARLSMMGVPFFLTVTALIPSVKQMPFLQDLHRWTTFFFVMCMIFSVHPFLLWLAKKKPHLNKLLLQWQLAILGGTMLLLIFQGQTGMFELWFFVMTLSLLITLAWICFGEAIDAAAFRCFTL